MIRAKLEVNTARLKKLVLLAEVSTASRIISDLNDTKDSSKNDKAAQTSRTPESVSSFNVDDIDEFCLHDLKDMVIKLGYGLLDLMYYHSLIPRLGLDYGLHPLNVDADVLEMAKYVRDYKIILVYVEHGSSIFVTPKKGVSIYRSPKKGSFSIAVNNSS
ncbi:hypothetical protein Tco_0537536 [Tanacetum coccineum]